MDDAARERASVLVLQSADRTTLLKPAAYSANGWPRSREPDAQRVVPLPDIVVGRHPGRRDAGEITLLGAYESFGPGTGYSALGAVALERARQRGIGRELPDEWFTQLESS
jgi:ornithine cyclodeaminase/alanine dehydrogenase-like protein (mu-crystallin family)